MMSGNPFRRSRLPDEHHPPPSLPSFTTASKAASNAAPSTTPRRTKKKRVKIQTPPRSPAVPSSLEDNGGRRLSASDSAGRAASPPPPVSVFDENESESDSTATADSELEEASRNTRRNSGSLPPQQGAPDTGSMRAPFNPFARTLATQEAGFGLQREGTEEWGTELRQVNANGTLGLDVESFKNILMTGNATPSTPTGRAGTAVPVTTLNRPQDSSSTDTSSVFDPGYNIHPQSPRISFDDYEDASTSGDDDRDEHSNLMGEGRLDDLAPPAPPKPKVRGPQTVSFAHFDQPIPSNFRSPARGNSPANLQPAGILRPFMPRSSSDLNKPLPPPPRDMSEPAPPSVPAKDSTISPPLTPTGPLYTIDDEATPKKAAPPPPPPSRRTAGETGRPRSVSNLSGGTHDSADSIGTGGPEESTASSKSEDAPTGKLAPPPPPSRRPNATALPLSDTSSKEPSPSQSSNEVPKAGPLPPPRRHLSKSIRNESSARSSLDMPRPMRPGDAFLAAATSQNAPPAPPPRRTGSKRSSMDEARENAVPRVHGNETFRRGSGTSVDSQRSTSLSSLRQVSGPLEEEAVVTPSGGSQRDILADMSAFQAEIEALRLQHETSR